jgi:DNA-binding FrmR family transcriptional regulator
MSEDLAPCGCATGDRHAIAVDPEIKRSVLNRLKRIEGQVRGLQRMVEEERYCADVITQVSSVQEALRGTARSLLHNHLKHCATQALSSGDSTQAEAMYAELMELMGRVN